MMGGHFMYPLLEKINTPNDVKKLSIFELEALARELRSMIIETVATNGGHLAPNLGGANPRLA